MLGFITLTVSNVERSLAFYEAALKPLNIKFFLPYKGKDETQIRLTPDPNIITRFHRKMVELDL